MKELLDQWEREAKDYLMNGPDTAIDDVVQSHRILSLISALRIMEEALKFYAERQNIKFLIPPETMLNFDLSYPNWRIGQHYIDSVEYGQRAHQSLLEAAKVLGEKE